MMVAMIVIFVLLLLVAALGIQCVEYRNKISEQKLTIQKLVNEQKGHKLWLLKVTSISNITELKNTLLNYIDKNSSVDPKK